MASIMPIIIVCFLAITSTTLAYQTSAKLRRDGILNLYPFPRVGRSSWDVPLGNLYLESKQSKKSQLYAFPRVGRRDEDLLIEKQPLYLRLEPGGYPEGRPMKPFGRPLIEQITPDSNVKNENFGKYSQGISQDYGDIRPKLDLIRDKYHQGFNKQNSVRGNKNGFNKRESESTQNTGMWFGPRLGRSDKNIEDFNGQPEEIVKEEVPQSQDMDQMGERIKRKI